MENGFYDDIVLNKIKEVSLENSELKEKEIAMQQCIDFLNDEIAKKDIEIERLNKLAFENDDLEDEIKYCILDEIKNKLALLSNIEWCSEGNAVAQQIEKLSIIYKNLK